jgi:hypothetical protein
MSSEEGQGLMPSSLEGQFVVTHAVSFQERKLSGLPSFESRAKRNHSRAEKEFEMLIAKLNARKNSSIPRRVAAE